MNNSIPVIHTSSSLSVFIDGRQFSMPTDDMRYEGAVKALQAGDVDKLRDLFNLKTTVGERLNAESEGLATIEDGDILYKGEIVNNALTRRILGMLRGGLDFNVKPMLRFLERLMENPSYTARQELYLFLESCTLPITEDGHFLAYKRVKKIGEGHFESFHPSPDGTHLQHIVGETVLMDRGDVDDQRNNLCSKGLHFCSEGYLPSYYGGGATIVVKIDPADVVSIPSDYDNAKGRACKYVVMNEVDYHGGARIEDDIAYDTVDAEDFDVDDDFDDFDDFDDVDDVDDFGDSEHDILTDNDTDVPSGSDEPTNGSNGSVLNEDQVREIRLEFKRAYERGLTVIVSHLARKYGVSPRTIGRVRDYVTWPHVTV